MGKKAWELHEEKIVCAKFFKAVYYPRDDYLHAKVASRASHSFENLMKLQSLIKLGLEWIVNDDFYINPWVDSTNPNALYSRT